ncbi:ATP synthase subunit I [Defluviitalea saccharophila]|uniref:ATP synthase subunit I n=1 Tax=Defluviitalea saccharophila TaxID=879970 RepID=A0ABZ2Y0E0_9FIRM
MNDRVPERNRLILRMIILGTVIGIAGSFIAEDSFGFIKGVSFGTIFSVLRLRLMEISIKKAVQMEKSRAQKYAASGYIARYILTGLVLTIAALEPSINLLGTVFGMLTMKAAVFLELYRDKKRSPKGIKVDHIKS